MKEDDMSVPWRKNGFYYYQRYEKGNEYPLFCRKKGDLQAEEEVLLDINHLAEGQAFVDIGSIEVSPDQEQLAYTIDFEGRRKYSLYILNLKDGSTEAAGIPNCGGDLCWANDNKTLFLTVIDEEKLRYDRVFRYVVQSGEPAVEVYYEKDETFYYISTEKTTDDRYILINCTSTMQSETLILDADTPLEPFRVFQARTKDVLYDVEHFRDQFYIVTNLNAQNFKLLACPEKQTTLDYWSDVIPHNPDVLLESIQVFNNFLVVGERTKGLARIRIIDQNLHEGHYLEFEEEAYTVHTIANTEMDTAYLRFSYSSLTTPHSVYDYNMADRSRILQKQQEVNDLNFKTENYLSKRIYITANDGVEVPVSIVFKKETHLDGSHPLLLYAYGSYGISTDPYFSSNRLSLLDRGFIFAIAHVRGGEEMGRWWYEAGKLTQKKNTFTDYISVAEYLISNNYTAKDKLFGMGGSAGGLLMGAIVNMRPDLWKGIIASVPFVDVLTTMLDENIPLTTAEYDEWGDPNKPEYYHYMKSYSPYDNIVKRDYPNILVTTGINDSQVQYWEPAKWVAKLRDNNTGESKILLYTNMDAGHGGSSGRYESLKEIALEYAFLFYLLMDTEEK